MEITKVTPVTYMSVETEDEEYYRGSSDNWFVWMGESLEPHYHCEEIERLYQKFINK